MARRRRNEEEKTYNRGGYSQAALDALETGRYREFSGNRQSQYRTSQEQTQAAPKPVPALEGMTRSPEFSGRNSYVDTDRARAKYAERINYTPFTLETPQTSNDENYVVKRDRYDKLMQDSRLANDIKNLYYAQPDGYGGEIVPEGYKNHKEYREQLSKRYNLTKDELDDMVKTFGSDIYKESTARDKKLMQNYGKEHPVLGSLASFVGTLGGFGEGAVNAVSGLLTGDDRNLSHTFSNTKNSFREGAKQKIKSNAGKTAYDIGMGIGDMAVGAAAGSAPVILAGNTANEAQESALKRGSSVRKSSLYGAGAGVLDFVTNKIGLDKAKKLAVDSIKSSGVKKFLAQNAIAGLGEAGENVLQDIGQSLLDLINGGNAEVIQSYNDKISRGMSDSDAFKEVAKEYATQLATSGALGFGMGSAMQAGATIAPKIPALISRKTPSEIPQGDVNNRVESPENLQPDMENVNRTMAESIGANNPRLVKKLEGDELKAAQKKVADNNNAINALKNEIKVIENDPKNKHRGSLKKSVKADIEQRKAQIAELQNDNKATKRQINGEPTPVIEQLDADSVSRINSFKSEVRKIGNMWGGEGGKQLAKEVNDALDRYIETGSREDLVDFRDKLYTLHDSATGEYTSKNGNVSRYSDYYGDRELGIYEDLASGNSLLNKALSEADNLRNAKQTTPDVETANNVPPENTTSDVPPTNPLMPSDGGDRVRSFSRRGSNDETLPDEIRNTLSEDYYKIVRNQDVEARADSLFVPENLTQTRSNLDRAVEDHDPAAALLSYRLAKAYVDNGDYDAATDVLQNVSAELTRMGQFTQAAKLAMLQNDPMAAMRSYMRDLEKLNQWGRDKYKGKWNNLELSEEDIATISNIQKGDSEALNSAIDALNEKFSKQIPSNWWDKTVSATKTAMLLNPRTQFRNVLANMATLPLRSASDRVAALGQNIAHLINDDVKVTQSVLGGTKEQKNIAAQVFDRLKDEITGENKMKDSVKSDILSQRQIFNDDFLGKWVDNLTNGGIQRLNEKFGANGNQSIMETLQNLTYWLMGDVGDTPFVKKNFVNRLASYMKAQGINNVDDIPDEAISLATQEALKATFKDDNAFTKALQGVKQKTGKFGEVALPFVKTPANLTMRAIDYSPAGLINTFRKIKSNADASAVIDDLSKNLTGTALIYLGYKLAEKGLLSGSYSQDADEAAFQKQQGMLENAIHIGDNYYTYDWTQPASTPLVLGQTIYEGVKASDQENANIWDIVNATHKGGLRVANTVINSSPLQSLADLLGDSPYSDEGIAENITNEILEFPQRFIPSILGATARTIDPVMRDTYIKDTTLTGTLGNQARQAMAKVPFLSRTLPASYDTWGNERTRSDSTGEAFFAQMVNPGQLGNKNETPLDAEIQRIFDATGNNAVFPLYAARSLDLGSDGNITLTNKQHSDYQKAMGQRSYSYAESIINNPEYQNLSDDEKASMLEKAYKLSNDITKEEMFNHVTDNNKNLKEVARTGDSEAVAKYLFDNIKADNLGMTMKTYQEKEAEYPGGAEQYAADKQKADALGMSVNTYNKKESEQPGGAVAYAQNKQAAKDNGFVDKDGDVDTKGYEKVISKAGTQSEKLINDLPALQQTGLEKSAYYTYANAINVIPSLTPSEFAQTYNEINTNKSNAMTQKELLAFLNMYQFSDDPAEDERIANEYWRAYGGWTNKAGVEKKIKFQDGQWKSYY